MTFLCPTSGKPVRTIGVRTGGGRRVLAHQVEAAGRLHSLKDDIAEGRVVEVHHPMPHIAATLQPVMQA